MTHHLLSSQMNTKTVNLQNLFNRFRNIKEISEQL